MDEFRYKWFALIGLSLCAFTAFLDFTIVSIAIPYVQAYFNAKITMLQWVNTIFIMVVSVSMIAVGKVSEFIDRRKVFYCGFIFFGIASIGAAMSPNIYALIGFRALQGLGTAIVFTQSAALLPQAFPLEKQRFAISFYSVFTGLGLALGPFIGGLIVSWLSWRYIFWFNIPIILIGLLCCIPSLKKPQVSQEPFRFDFIGLFLLIVSVFCIIYGMVQLEHYGVSLFQSLVSLIVGLIAVLFLCYYENNYDDPLINLAYFKNKYVLIGVTMTVAGGAIINIFLFLDPLYLKIIKQLDPHFVGLLLVSMPAMQIIISALFPLLVKKAGLIQVMLGGMIFGLIATLLNVQFTATISVSVIVLTFALMGVLWGCINTGIIMLVSDHFSEKISATVIGFVFTFWNISGAFFLSLSSILFHFFNAAYLKKAVKSSTSMLSSVQKQTLHIVLNDPSRAVKLLHEGNNSLYALFSSSFTYALGRVSWLSCGFMILLVLLCFLLYRAVKQRGC